ncbi:H-type small acid-soluble spore protein [Caldibacillus lycopersici]|uniref:Small, acid-soluble spore protein H n=1 Tax=Perspicuibacillus lycopersici TaxID=1325689 RepID=A0AAE3ISI2_9BACI|nr:H-type small acid-soluble spore protein [Perspicuibacillus lycopersici]MCU9613397.1 H-type small acid-soluble spore protein [Perspicuibacillus lycopersici]
MDFMRAKEIVNSPTMINVSYRGIPVYIQSVQEDSNIAVVYPLDEMHNKQEVDLAGLTEEGP